LSVEQAERSMALLGQALKRLTEALAVPPDAPLALDGTIQRFEFTFELFWKTIQRLLALEGIEANSPRSCLREAYRIGWLQDEPAWLKLLESRNLTTHTYREEVARQVYRQVREGLPILRADHARLAAMLAAHPLAGRKL
jgi:nucleotidyltransferase substrate binding protein (TIGR01987 family)